MLSPVSMPKNTVNKNVSFSGHRLAIGLKLGLIAALSTGLIVERRAVRTFCDKVNFAKRMDSVDSFSKAVGEESAKIKKFVMSSNPMAEKTGIKAGADALPNVLVTKFNESLNEFYLGHGNLSLKITTPDIKDLKILKNGKDKVKMNLNGLDIIYIPDKANSVDTLIVGEKRYMLPVRKLNDVTLKFNKNGDVTFNAMSYVYKK